MENFWDQIKSGLFLSLSSFSDPESRLFYIYILSSLLMALLLIAFSSEKRRLISKLFDRNVWLGQSARVDYALFLFNGVVKVLLIGPYLISILYVAFFVSDFLHRFVGDIHTGWSKAEVLIYYTLALSVVNDFGVFLLHYLLHKIPFLWAFHKVHHSATHLNPITQYRIHPIELFLQNVRGLFIPGFVLGVFEYLSDFPVQLWMIMGVNGVSFLFRLLGANLRHSEIPFRFPRWLEWIFISPYQHQIHHSALPEHYNKNLGGMLSCWDWLFGTLIPSSKIQDIEYGLGKEDENYSSFWQNLYRPFIDLFRKQS